MTTGITCPIPIRVTDDDGQPTTQPCGSPAHQASALCAHHWHRLADDLAIIDRILRAIGDNPDAWRQRPVTDNDPVHVSRQGSPAPGRIDVMAATDRRGLVVQAVIGWARDIARTDRALDLVEAARILCANHETLACHPALPDPVTELHTAACELRSLCDEHWNTQEQDQKTKPVGRCTEPHTDDPMRNCGGDLHWVRNTMATRCQRCGHEQEPDGWLPKRLILGPFGLERRTLDRWIQAGLVTYINQLVCVDDVRVVVKMRRAASAVEG